VSSENADEQCGELRADAGEVEGPVRVRQRVPRREGNRPVNKAFFAVPSAMLLAGITLVAIAFNAAEEFRLFGAPMERSFGFVLGGVGIFGAVAVAAVIRGKMKAEAESRRRRIESQRPRA
jgi:hypothetical protein